jgi:hypothetical protein
MKLTRFALLPWRFTQHVSPKRWYYQLKYRLSHPKDHNVIFTTARVSEISILFRFLEDTSTGETACVIFRVVVRLTEGLTAWSGDILEKLLVPQSGNILNCVEPSSLLPCLQERATCHYPEPVQSSPRPYSPFNLYTFLCCPLYA